MWFVSLFIWGIIAYHVIYGLFLLIMNWRNSRILIGYQKSHQNNLVELPVTFTILVPCWKEQKIIQDTLEHFSKFRKSPYVSKVLILTSLGEQTASGANASTFDLAQAYVQRMHLGDFIEVIGCPAELIGKPQKINYGMQRILGGGDSAKKQYFCIYDADSRPSIDVIEIVVSCMRNTGTYADIYQQVSSYCNNLNSIKGLGKLYSIADAIAQTHWALGFEYSLYSEYSLCAKKGLLTPPFYLIGHGCFLSLDYYCRIGKIPEINHCDDAALGFLSGLMRAKLQVLPVLDTCDVAPTSFSSIMQSRSWYKGAAQYRKNLIYFMKQYNISVSKIQVGYWVCRETLRNFFWGWRAPLLFLTLILGLFLNSPYLPLGVLAAVIMFVELPYFSTLIVMKKLHGVDFSLKPIEIIAGAVIALVVFCGRCVGPFIGSLDFRQIKNDFTYKTKR